MERITKEVRQIADRYIQAKFDNKFDPKDFTTKDELIAGVKSGKVYRELLDEIEIRYVNITSLMIGAVLAHKTKAYQAGIYKGFKVLFQNN